MSVKWLLDASVFDTYHEELVGAILRNGFEAVSVKRPNPPYTWDDTDSAYRQAFPEGSCVVTHADIDLVNRVRTDARWCPGVFATVEHFYCSYYFPRLSQHLLNRDHAMLSFSDLQPRSRELFDRFGHNGRIFVRPDSPLKLFSGIVVTRATFDKDWEFMAFYEFPVDSLVLVSSAKSIVKEWRFIVADLQIVAGSEYKEGETLVARRCVDDAALAFGQEVLKTGFAPDPVWVMDICQTADGGFRLLEIGGFSFSNLYACDKDAVVQAVSRVALRVYNDARRSRTRR